MTWKRQPLDTHIFAVLKRKYQSFYYQQSFIENKTIKQIDTVYAYNQLMLSINKKLIIDSFNESILRDARIVPSIDKDPNPMPQQVNPEKEKIEENETDESNDDDNVNLFEDDVQQEESADELPEEMPIMRRPRQAHNVAYDARMAQIYQSSIIRA
jgi:hypothetical protein